jgi:S1-C subfamily serine protease
MLITSCFFMGYFNNNLISLILGAAATVALVQPQAVFALEATEISARAKLITISIGGPALDGGGNVTGSGVLVEKDGNTYTVLTNRHVVDTKGDYKIITSDGKEYQIQSTQVKIIPNIDLATIQFTSSQNYTVAEISQSTEILEGQTIYIAGYPDPPLPTIRRSFFFQSAQIIARLSDNQEGYDILHNNPMMSGSSGGPILNDKGFLVGINGKSFYDGNLQKHLGAGIPIVSIFSEL